MRADGADRFVEATGPETLSRWLSQIPDHVLAVVVRQALREMGRRNWPGGNVLTSALDTAVARWKRSLDTRVQQLAEHFVDGGVRR